MTYTVYILPSPRTARSGSNAVHRRLKLLTVSVFLRISTSWITSSCLLSCMDFSLTAGPPPRLSSRLPPVLLSESHLTARGHSLGPPRMWQHHAISKVPHLTAPPPPPQQACGWKLHTCITATAETVHTWKVCQFYTRSLQFYRVLQFPEATFTGTIHTLPFPHSYSLLVCLPRYSQIFYNPFQIKVIPLKHSTW